MEDGASAEIAVVGNEGIVGISLFMSGESTPSRALVVIIYFRVSMISNIPTSVSVIEAVVTSVSWRFFLIAVSLGFSR